MGADVAIDRLLPTGTVIGLFDEWDCRIQEIALNPGDTLVMFTDGVAEAFNANFEEFGEDRIVDLIYHRTQSTHFDAARLITDVRSRVLRGARRRHVNEGETRQSRQYPSGLFKLD